MALYRIGQLAQMAHIQTDTVRYYEDLGLLPLPARSSKGYRLYGENDLRRLTFINRAKEVGFTLKEIHSLLSLSLENQDKCLKAKQQCMEKLEKIEKKISELAEMRKALSALLAACQSNTEQNTECPILDYFEKGNRENEN